MERVAFELLLQIRGSKFDESDRKASKKLKNIHNRIFNLEGHQRHLDKKCDFLKILIDTAGYKDFPLAKVNLSTLTRHWFFCSEYCHLQFNLNGSWGNAIFVDKCINGLIEIEEFLQSILSNIIIWPQWSDDQWINELLNKYVDGLMDEDMVKSELSKKGVRGKFEKDGKAIFLSDLYKHFDPNSL